MMLKNDKGDLYMCQNLKNVIRRWSTWFKGLTSQIENKVEINCGISTHSITDHSKTGTMARHTDFCLSVFHVTEAVLGENFILWCYMGNK